MSSRESLHEKRSNRSTEQVNKKSNESLPELPGQSDLQISAQAMKIEEK